MHGRTRRHDGGKRRDTAARAPPDLSDDGLGAVHDSTAGRFGTSLGDRTGDAVEMTVQGNLPPLRNASSDSARGLIRDCLVAWDGVNRCVEDVRRSPTNRVRGGHATAISRPPRNAVLRRRASLVAPVIAFR